MPDRTSLSVEAEGKLVAIFDALNARHFGGVLPRPKRFLQMNFGGCFAFYMPKVQILGLHPRTLEQDEKFIADSLLHELVHYALELRTGDHDQHHGEAFIALANEIGASLGLPAVASTTVTEWPQSLRPAEYAPWR
jgi:predicted SprT family Zn-dependent metalloprotease